MNIAQKVNRRVFRTMGDNRAINPDAILGAKRRLSAIAARLDAIETEDDLVAAINGLETVAAMLLIHGREG